MPSSYPFAAVTVDVPAFIDEELPYADSYGSHNSVALL
jgi:hypothetical protein